jgi:hypothetical protein
MPNQAQYKRLFRNTTVEEKLTLFQTLLETSNELTAHLALALLKVIHKELSTDQIRDRMAYKRYAEGIESLRFHMPTILHQVVSAWRAQHNNTGLTPDEWFSRNQ